MTATVNANTTTGVVVTSDTSGALALQTGGTTALTISSAQAVSLTSGLAVTGSTTILKNGGTGASAGLQLNGGGASTTFNIDYGTATANRLWMRQAYSDGAGTIKFQYSSDGTMASPSDIFTANWGGGIAVTGLTDISAATSGQIKFPATQNASSDANTLDDYEEGIWTPTIPQGYSGVTYSSQHGWYTKVGRSVVISGRVNFSGTSTGIQIQVGGLPFTQGSIGGGAYGGGGIPYTTLAPVTNTSPYVGDGTAIVLFHTLGTGAQVVSAGNVSSVWVSFVVTIAT